MIRTDIVFSTIKNQQSTRAFASVGSTLALQLSRMKETFLATLLAPPDKTSNADLVFKVRAADPLLLLVAHALLDDGERLVVLLRVEAQLLEISDHGGKVGARVLSDAFVHLARLHRGLDHLVLSQDLWQQAPEKELSAQKDFHGRAA